MSFKFSKSSLDKLSKVHPDLQRVIKRALELSTIDFSVNESSRTLQRQKELMAQGTTQTLNSKHLVQSDGYGYAVDLVPYPLSWQLEKFYPIAEAVKKASEELSVKIRWGGAWIVLNNQKETPRQLVEGYSKRRRRTGNKVFIDAPHFELIK